MRMIAVIGILMLKGLNMTKFMGNGVRIKNVLKCLISDCFLYVYHVKSDQHYYSSSSRDVLNFMVGLGFADVFILRVEPVEVDDCF